MVTKQPTEYEEQCMLVKWMNIKKIFHFAVTNENNTYKQNRKFAMIAEVKARKSGKVKGTSDMVVLLPNKILFIEMKRAKKVLKNGSLSISNSKVSDEQYKFLTKINKLGYAEGTVAYGFNDAKSYIMDNMQ